MTKVQQLRTQRKVLFSVGRQTREREKWATNDSRANWTASYREMSQWLPNASPYKSRLMHCCLPEKKEKSFFASLFGDGLRGQITMMANEKNGEIIALVLIEVKHERSTKCSREKQKTIGKS